MMKETAAMEFAPHSNEQVREIAGARLRAIRKSRNLTQQEVADRAGLSRLTVSSIERGNDVNLDSFLAVLRTLDLLDALALTIPEPPLSPIAELSARSRRRNAAHKPTDHWAWGDER